MSPKTASLGLLKKTFWNKSFHIVISVHDVTNIILIHDPNCTVNVVMWPNLCNSSISLREVIITSILSSPYQRNYFFEKLCWFKFNNLELTLGAAVKFYTSVIKGLKPKVRKFWGVSPMFIEVTGGKLVGEHFWIPNPE